MRLNVDGTLDTSFAAGGVATLPVQHGYVRQRGSRDSIRWQDRRRGWRERCDHQHRLGVHTAVLAVVLTQARRSRVVALRPYSIIGLLFSCGARSDLDTITGMGDATSADVEDAHALDAGDGATDALIPVEAGCGVACGGVCVAGRCIETLAKGPAHRIAVDGANVYWTTLGSGTSDGAVLKVPKGGGTPVTLASTPHRVQWPQTAHTFIGLPRAMPS